MSFMSLLYAEYGKRVQGPHAVPDMSHMRQMSAPATYRVDFHLIYVAIGVPGFKMSWTTRPKGPGDDRHGGSTLCLAREFSTVLTSSAATHVIQEFRPAV
jgi:hypothetical protein